MMDLHKLLKPRSIAVIGASERDGFGGDTCRNLFRFTKNVERIYLVNPKWDTLFGRPCYPSVADVPDEVDLVILCTPQKTVEPLLEQAAQKGCKGAVVFASGYSETGAEGRKLQHSLVELCQKYGIAMMGPNCAGFANFVDEIFSFAFQVEERDRTGSIGMISQSGQICLSALDSPNLKFSYLISSGNSACICVEDYLNFLVEDPHTKVVAGYLEGISDPQKLLKAFSKAKELKKPVVILKTGRSAKSKQLAASHTGSLSGSDEAFQTVMERYGVIRVNDLQELYTTADALATLSHYPEGERFAFLNVSGGEAGITADLANRYGVILSDLSKETLEKLSGLLPSYATANNPLDMTANLSYDSDRLAQALQIISKDPQVDAIGVGYTITPELFDTTVRFMTEAVRIYSQQSGMKPLFWIPFVEHTREKETADILRKCGVPLLASGMYGFQALKNVCYFVSESRRETCDVALPSVSGQDWEGKTFQAHSEYDSMVYLESQGIAIPGQLVATTKEEAVAAAHKFGYPVVCKIDSPDILHKSDVGGVMLNLSSDQEVERAFDLLLHNASKHCPSARIHGVLVKSMLKSATEIIIGVNRDPQFGPIVMVGLGGVFVEIFKDVQIAPAPLRKEEALSMIQRLKGYPLLNGYRGKPPCDVDALATLLVQISELAANHRDTLKELDLNPVFVDENGVAIADALVICVRKN